MSPTAKNDASELLGFVLRATARGLQEEGDCDATAAASAAAGAEESEGHDDRGQGAGGL